MSRGLERSATELERKAKNKAAVIRRVCQEYNESIKSDPAPKPALQSKKEREVERVVAEYMKIHKALKRLRKKLRAGK